MSPQVSLGFVGLGTMGRDLLHEAVANPLAHVMALCDMDSEAIDAARARLSEPVKTYSDYEQFLKDPEIQAVIVATPQYLHPEISIAALNSGKDVFCEKPMALTVSACREMLRVAAVSGKSLMIGQVLRYIHPYRFLLDTVRSGELGNPFAMRTMRSLSRWGSWLRPWRARKETAGGFLYEVNVHEIDLMLQVLGPAERVEAVGKHFVHPEVDYEDFVTAHIEFKNGTLGTFTSVGWDHIGRNCGEVFLEGGTIYYDSLTAQVVTQKDGSERVTYPYKEIHPEWESGVYRELREFMETCLGQHPVTIPGEDGLRAVEILEAALRSAAEHRPIDLPL